MNNLNITDRIAGKKIIQKRLIDERQLYHPFGVFVPHHNLYYNHNIPLGLKTKTRRVATIIENDMTYNPKTQRVGKIIEMISLCNFQTRRVERIIEMISLCIFQTQRVDMIIDEKNEWRNYHPAGVSILHRNSCYNHRIPLGLKTKIQKVATIIENDMTYKPKTRRVGKIIEMISLCNFQTRRVEMIIDDKIFLSNKTRRVERIIEMISLCIFQTQRVDKIIDEKSEWRNYHPTGVSIIHHLSCYNHHIPLGLKTKF